MKRDQFSQRFKNLDIDQREIERKYQTYLREQEEQKLRMLYEQAMQSSSSSATAGGGSGSTPDPNPRALVATAQSVLITYRNEETGTIGIFAVVYEDDAPVFSEPIDTEILIEDAQSMFLDDVIERGGYCINIGTTNNLRTLFFIDAAGNLVEKVENLTSESSSSYDGIASSFAYFTGPNTLVLKWWSGDYMYTHTFTDVIPGTFSNSWFADDRATLDGTFSFYYDSTETESTKVYFANSKTGVITEITEAVTYNAGGPNAYTKAMHQAGNFVYATFIDSSTTTSTYDCTAGDNFITLTAPNPNIRIGDTVTGLGIVTEPPCIVSDINGLIVTYIGDPIDSTQEGVTATFSSNQVELLRVIKTDGTYQDFDLSSYHSTLIQNDYLVGSDKLVLHLKQAAIGLDFAYCIYNHTSETLSVFTGDSSVYTGSTALYTQRPILYDSVVDGGPFSTENFVLMLHGSSVGNDGTMNRYDGPSIKFIWTGTSTTGYYEMEVAPGIGESFGFVNSYDSSTPGVFFANSPGGNYLEILLLENDGEWQFVSMPTLYADAGNYFEVAPLSENYSFLTYYDNSREGDVQYINVYNLNTLTFVGSPIWMTTNNGWETNKDTFYLAQYDEDATYWFNSSADEIGTIAGAYNESYRSESFSSSSYVNYQRTGTTVLYYPNLDKIHILASGYVPPAEVDITGKPFDSIRVSEEYVYYMWTDPGLDNAYTIDVYDREGTPMLTVSTGTNTYNDFRVYHDRAYFQYQDGLFFNLIAISPLNTNIVQYLVDGSELHNNDWRWWD